MWKRKQLAFLNGLNSQLPLLKKQLDLFSRYCQWRNYCKYKILGWLRKIINSQLIQIQNNISGISLSILEQFIKPREETLCSSLPDLAKKIFLIDPQVSLNIYSRWSNKLLVNPYALEIFENGIYPIFLTVDLMLKENQNYFDINNSLLKIFYRNIAHQIEYSWKYKSLVNG